MIRPATITFGPVRAQLGPGPQLRDLSVGGEIVLDSVALTLRGPGWVTWAAELVDSEGGADTDHAADQVVVRQRWRAEPTAGVVDAELIITAERVGPEVLIEVAAVTTPTVDLELFRIGLVVLLPLELVGRAVTLRTPEGVVAATFPTAVSPHPPFPDVLGLDVTTTSGHRMIIDLATPYEIEDHRNWTDAGFKGYSPPLREPLPQRLTAGVPRRSSVAVRLTPGSHAATPDASGGVVEVSVGRRRHQLAELGVGVGDRLSPDPGFRPGFVHGEVVATGPDDPVATTRLQVCVEQAAALDVPLRLTLACGEADLPGWLPRVGVHATSLLVVDPVTHCSTPRLIALARAGLAGTDTSVVAGTRGYVAEYGRSATPFDGADAVQLAVTPEVHHTEAERVFDTLRAHPAVVAALRTRSEAPMIIAPVTLAPRTTVHRPAGPDDAPWSTAFPPDPRANDQFGAAWLLGAVAGLAGVDAVSLFSLADGHGLLINDRPTPAARLLAELLPLVHHERREVIISDPRRVAALAVDDHVWLANLTPDETQVQVDTRRVVLGGYAVAVSRLG